MDTSGVQTKISIDCGSILRFFFESVLDIEAGNFNFVGACFQVNFRFLSRELTRLGLLDPGLDCIAKTDFSQKQFSLILEFICVGCLRPLGAVFLIFVAL